MLQFIDPAAFMAALSAAARPSLQAVTLPGVGACYKRPVTVGDVLDAENAHAALVAAGITIDRKAGVAIGLAQTLCTESGQPLLDHGNPEHIRLLMSLPWEALRGVLMPGEEHAAEQAAPNA